MEREHHVVHNFPPVDQKHYGLTDPVLGQPVVVTFQPPVDTDAAGIKALLEADVEQVVLLDPDLCRREG